MNRREFLAFAMALGPALMISNKALSMMPEKWKPESTDTTVFDNIMAKASRHNWRSLPIGERIVKIGTELLATPYRGGTLEVRPERCTVTLVGLDCVTFFESCLVMARMIAAGLVVSRACAAASHSRAIAAVCSTATLHGCTTLPTG